MIGIYKITSPTNKVYIGQSWTLNKRDIYYRNLACKHQKKIYNSIKKHGWEYHTYEIIHELPVDISQQILDNYEIFYWQKYKDLGFEMLNVKEPGRGGKHNEETKQLMSFLAKNRSKDYYDKNNNMLKSLATKKKIKIIQYDLQGNFIREWDSASDAARSLKIISNGISNAVRLSTSYKESIWKKYYDGYPLNIKPYENNLKKVYQKDLNGNIIKIWEHLNKAAKELNIPRGVLQRRIDGKVIDNNYIWTYYN